jgi:4-hydroxy-2-oxoheptanedioate aldolase
MRPNLLIERMTTGTRPAINGWLSMGSPFVAELMAHQAWDALTIDMQHGVGDFNTTVDMLRAISTTDVTPMVRVPWLEPGIIMRVADAGAYGIICPMVNTRRECEAFVSASRYAPQGTRSFGPTRAPLYAGAEYWKTANETVLTFAMIETTEALQNLEQIVSVPGLSGVYIGPADLSLSMGFDPINDQAHPKVLHEIERIKSAADDAGIFTVMHCASPELAKQMINKKFSMITVMNDSRMLTIAFQRVFKDLGLA